MQFGIDPQTLIFTILAILIGLTVHEFMHAYVGLKLGDTTAQEQGRISFNPFQHIDPIMTVALPIITLLLFQAPILAAKPVPFNPDRVKYDEFGAAMIAAAGPLSNLVLAVLGAGILRYVGVSELAFNALTIFIAVNVGVFIFNLIPIPPLDGSRVLYAFAPEPLQRVMAQLEQFGIFLVFALLFLIPGFGAFINHLVTSILYALIRV